MLSQDTIFDLASIQLAAMMFAALVLIAPFDFKRRSKR